MLRSKGISVTIVGGEDEQALYFRPFSVYKALLLRPYITRVLEALSAAFGALTQAGGAQSDQQSLEAISKSLDVEKLVNDILSEDGLDTLYELVQDSLRTQQGNWSKDELQTYDIGVFMQLVVAAFQANLQSLGPLMASIFPATGVEAKNQEVASDLNLIPKESTT